MQDARRSGLSKIAFSCAGETCRVMPVIGGEDMLGSLAIFHRGTLDDVAVRTFERSSSVIGIVLLSQDRMEATRSRDMATLLRALVSPRQDDLALLANGAERHGIDLTRPLSLVLLDTEAQGGAVYAARHMRQGTTPGHALVDEIDGVLVVLVNATQATGVREKVAASARASGGAYRGVMSRPVAGPAEIPALFATLKRGLAVLRRIGVRSEVVAQNELALYSTLFETHDNASLAEFIDATIGPLIAHDARRGTDLSSTLLALFDASQNARATAQRLGIHVNTVRQRLVTIAGLVGTWEQASRALELHVALRLRSLVGPPRSDGSRGAPAA